MNNFFFNITYSQSKSKSKISSRGGSSSSNSSEVVGGGRGGRREVEGAVIEMGVVIVGTLPYCFPYGKQYKNNCPWYLQGIGSRSTCGYQNPQMLKSLIYNGSIQ